MFSDFNKKTSDLVSKDFPADCPNKRESRRFEYKATSASGTGVTFSAFQKASDKSFDASLSLKKKCPKTDVVHEVEVKGDNVKLTLTSEGKLHPDAKAILVSEVDPASLGSGCKWGGSFETQHRNSQVGSSLKVEQKKCGQKELTFSSTFTNGNIASGFQAKLDAKPESLQSVPEASFGLQHSTSDLTVGAVLSSTRGKAAKVEVDAEAPAADGAAKAAPAREVKLTVSAWQQFNPSTQFGALVEVPVGSKTATPKISAVAQRSCSGETAKIRLVVPDGRVGLFYSAKFGTNVTLGLSADVNVLKIREGVNDDVLRYGVKYSVSSE